MPVHPLRAVCLCLLLLAGLTAQTPLQTVAEASDFTATGRLAEVQSFCARLAERSARVTLGSIGQTAEGRNLPLLIVGDPPPADPAELGERIVVLAFGGIHAGEVCGKEALQMLARDLALAEQPGLLGDVVLLLVPVLNGDGNERMRVDNRPGQVGPEQGMGTRRNGQGLNLNRDFVKLEAPATRGLVRLIREWDPALLIDTHTTDGSQHRHPLTYDSPRHPATPAGVLEFARDVLLPAAGERLAAQGDSLFFYGNFSADQSGWNTYPAMPRYSTHYGGLRNRISILSEAYAYAPYERRVRSSYRFVAALAGLAAERRPEIQALLAHADEQTQEAVGDSLAIATRNQAFAQSFTVFGIAADGTPHDYRCRYDGLAVASRKVQRPRAYLFPPGLDELEQTLQRHGIEVEELREDLELAVESYRLEALDYEEQLYEGRRLARLEVRVEPETNWVRAGTRVVRCAQPLGNLAVVLLEPEAEDGLARWGMLDGQLRLGERVPVLRLVEEHSLMTRRLASLPEEAAAARELSFEDYAGGLTSIGEDHSRGLEWLDNDHYLQRRPGGLYRVDARSGRAERYPGRDEGSLVQALQTTLQLDGKQARQLLRRAQASHDPTRGRLFSYAGDLYWGTLDGSLQRLTETPEQAEELALLSPDDQRVAFVRDHDLFVVELTTGTVRRLTSDGSDTLSNGKTDWVYMEEVYGRGRRRAFWWSPDSERIALLQFDDSPVPRFPLVNHSTVPPQLEHVHYPKAGDPNPRVRLGVVAAQAGEVQWADLSGYPVDATLITRVGWLPDSQAVFFYAQDRAQTWLDMNLLRGANVTTLFRETTGAWVDNPGDPRFLQDGSFLLSSERSGYAHLYHFEPDGRLRRAVTEGAWEVRGIELLDEAGGQLFFRCTRDSWTGEQLYRVALDGTGLRRVSFEEGSHSFALSPDGRWCIDTWSRSDQPPRVALFDTQGRRQRWIDTNPVPGLAELRLGRLEELQIPLPDGFVLEAQLSYPPDFDPRKRYPVWLQTYGGPHAPTVRNAWRGGRLYEKMLASLGFVIFRCDPRSASGKGAVSAWSAYRQLGVSELADLEAALDWLGRNPWVDTARIGISGHSYGGFLTAFALTHSGRFRAGVAGAPVTDWRLYDSIYTERYMDTPEANPEGYRETSVIEAAGQLHGALLILHGAADDNVHMQNSLRLAEALQRQDQDFELMVYPSSRHGIRGAHNRRLIVEFMLRELMGAE